MDAKYKIVTQLPLTELWHEDGFSTALRSRWLTTEEIMSLLRIGPVQFVVANIGTSLRWIPLVECHAFWKTEVQQHFAAPGLKISLDTFPDGYCYFASEWNSQAEAAPIIVCEKHH
jgi:hypothetical protein